MPNALMRLLFDPGSGVTQQAAERAYLSGLDQIPWPCRNRLNGGELIVERSVAESGKLQIPFLVEGRGEVMLSTGTLMQRERPYRLEIELARGKINQVRNQMEDWRTMGLIVAPAVESTLGTAMDEFAQAVTAENEPAAAAARARKAIAVALEAGELLADCYVEQALAMRHRQMSRLPTLLGAKLGPRVLPAAAMTHLQTAFNALVVPLIWRDVEATEGNFQWQTYDKQLEWCQAHGIQVCGGPLVRLDPRGMPDWLCLWEKDFDTLLQFAADYVSSAVGRYKGKVAMWQCAARVNVANVFSLQEEQKLQLAVRALETARRVDPETPAIIRFDQPWGEYLRNGDFDLSPLHFADALVRAGLQLSGIGLEINVGYFPGGTAMRDRLDFNRMLDLWSYLGLPLHVYLTVPSSVEADPKARNNSAPPPDAVPWTPALQASWVKRYVPLMLAKSYVQSVTWNQLSDADPHEFPHAGLFDAAGAAKPSFAALGALRKKHLQ